MNTFVKEKVLRWVLLRHIGAPEDKGDIHFDFLLEDQDFCRTWRLNKIPLLDGPYVASLHIAPHNLYWLDIEEKVISGNRGIATRVKNGIVLESLPSVEKNFLNLSLKWDAVESNLVINENGCKIFSKID